MEDRRAQISQILGRGERDSMSDLMPLVYDELRALAAARLQRERHDHTLQPTALANEAYLRLVSASDRNWQSRAHFFGVAGRLMRQILVDHARTRNAKKRGGDLQRQPISIAAEVPGANEGTLDVLALDGALNELADLDPRKAQVLQLRYFAGLKRAEVAEVLGVSESTIDADWHLARSWLATRLG